ncbi:MAG TPA: EAL domain-containing protein, partial [Actinoplanes sp.]|nr:EAL domain-containing protein [Actinoplanes sp.]
GLVAALDDFVLDRACADLPALAELFGGPVSVHVNVSAARLHPGPAGDARVPAQRPLVDSVALALHRHRVPAGRLVVEITETRRIPDLAIAAAVVTQLRDSGVRVALDDFGSGFNALAQLHALPVDIVKLDSTLTDVDTAPERAGTLCRSVLAICAGLEITVIAEGVETPARAGALAALGCPLGQGYLFGPAGPVGSLSSAAHPAFPLPSAGAPPATASSATASSATASPAGGPAATASAAASSVADRSVSVPLDVAQSPVSNAADSAAIPSQPAAPGRAVVLPPER